MITHIGLRPGLLLVALLAAACDSSSPAGPPASTHTGTFELRDVLIVGAPEIVHPGRKQGARAVAQYSDGGYLDVTRAATWSSSDPACGVSAGEVSGVAAGIAEIRAAFGGRVSPPARVACGYVVTITTTENAPTKHVRVPGVAGEVLDGPLAGHTFVTDSSGQAVLPPVAAAGFRIRLTKEGFTSQTETIRELPRDTAFGVAMVPTFGKRREFVGGCSGDSAQFDFRTTRSGPIRLTVDLTDLSEPNLRVQGDVYALPSFERIVRASDYSDPPFDEPPSATAQAAAGDYRLDVYMSCSSASRWRAVLEYSG